MKMKIYTEEELSVIFFPESFWDQLERLYQIPTKELARFKDKKAMLVYALQMQQYQHGLITFISEVASKLRKEEAENFRAIAGNIFAQQVEKYADFIGRTCRTNILQHCEQQYEKINTMNTNNTKTITLTVTNIESFIQENPVALVDFWADWCAPCKAIAPTIEKIAKKYHGTVGIGKVNIEDNRDLTQSYQVTSIPTLVVFKNGQEIKRLVGNQSHAVISKALDQALAQQ